jgi:hypothetical protein
MISQGDDGQVPGSARQFGIAAIFAICLAAPVLEMFDRRDQTLQTARTTSNSIQHSALA